MSSLIVDVCRVDEISKHPNADRLSIVRVKGWNCIVGLDQYEVGQLVVFVPPDCIIPDSIIDKYNLEYLKHNGRTGSVKLRGYISQGLILDLPDGKFKDGDNVAEILGIAKYEQPEPAFSGQANQVSKKKLNPAFSKYTNIENYKNFDNIFNNEDVVVITEKIHGANARFGNLEIVIDKSQPVFYRLNKWIEKNIFGKTHEFVYGSHNVQLYGKAKSNTFYGDDKWGSIAKKYDLANKIPKDYVVYGEVYGSGIQDLTYGIDDIKLVVFDVRYKGTYLNWGDMIDFCYELNLPLVPILHLGLFNEEVLKQCTDGNSIICSTQIREGCVVKPLIEENHPRIGRKILKSRSVIYETRKDGTEFK